MKEEQENYLTGEEFNITGRGRVLLCHNCTYKMGDTFEHEGKTLEIRGIETMGGRMDRVGLLVKELLK